MHSNDIPGNPLFGVILSMYGVLDSKTLEEKGK